MSFFWSKFLVNKTPHIADICPCEDCACPKEPAKPLEVCSLSNEACECAPAEYIPYKDTPCNCGRGATMEPYCVATTYPKLTQVSDADECCCSCDEELCECHCCEKNLDIADRRIQTSRFCLIDTYTQTDKVIRRKRCCRCCRCCNAKGQGRCGGCANKLMGQTDQSPRSPERRYRQKTVSGLDQIPSRTKTDQSNYTEMQYYPTKYQQDEGKRTKTLMVRTNSVQCLPSQENKATCCSCDEKFSDTRYRRIHLHGPNYDKIKAELLGDLQKQTVKLEAADINAMTSAKLRNLLLEGDVYSSPVSGRNYDLSCKTIENPKMATNKTSLKPLDIDEEIQYTKLSSQCFASEVEHTKLMTAICDAILSNCNDKDEKASSPIEPSRPIEENEPIADETQDYTNKIDQLERKISRLMSENRIRSKSRTANRKSKTSLVNKTSKSVDHKNDPLEKYENLLSDNQKCVDELLGQLQALHGCDEKLKEEEEKSEVSCCFDRIDDDFPVNLLGTGEHLKFSSNNFSDRLELSRNAQGETFNMEASTSKDEAVDFSKIIFTPQSTNDDNLNCWMTSQNFITQNLPVFTTNITDCYTIEKLLRDDRHIDRQQSPPLIVENLSLSDANSPNSDAVPISPSLSVCANNNTVDVKKDNKL